MVRGVAAQPEGTAARIRTWVELTDRAVAELMPLHTPLSELQGAHRHKRAVMLLSTACLGRTGDVLDLVASLRLWGAELVMRSVVEGTAKFGFLLKDRATFTVRCIEYRDALPIIARRRRHAKSTEALKALAAIDASDPPPFRDLLLTEQELAEIDAVCPKEVRTRIEKRWGFGALIDAVSKPDLAFGPRARALLHGYSVASDLQHMTYDGVDMPLERDQRATERRDAIELAHAAKLASDCFHLAWLRISTLLRFADRSNEALFAVRERHSGLLGELAQAGLDWETVEYGGPAASQL